jgi:hypothetical protein
MKFFLYPLVQNIKLRERLDVKHCPHHSCDDEPEREVSTVSHFKCGPLFRDHELNVGTVFF